MYEIIVLFAKYIDPPLRFVAVQDSHLTLLAVTN